MKQKSVSRLHVVVAVFFILLSSSCATVGPDYEGSGIIPVVATWHQDLGLNLLLKQNLGSHLHLDDTVNLGLNIDSSYPTTEGQFNVALAAKLGIDQALQYSISQKKETIWLNKGLQSAKSRFSHVTYKPNKAIYFPVH